MAVGLEPTGLPDTSTVKSVRDILQRLLKQSHDLGNLPITEESFEALRHAQEHLMFMTDRAIQALEQEIGDAPLSSHPFKLGDDRIAATMASFEREVSEAFEYCAEDQEKQADLLRGNLEAHSMSSHMSCIDELRKELDNELPLVQTPELQTAQEELRSTAVAVRRRGLEDLIAREKKGSEQLFEFMRKDLGSLLREQFRQINEEYLRVKELCKQQRAELIRKLQSDFEKEEEHIRSVLEAEHQSNIESLKQTPLQRRDLLNHVELIRDAVAGYVGGSVEDLKADVLGHLQCLAQQMGADFNSDVGQQQWAAAAFSGPSISAAARPVPVEVVLAGRDVDAPAIVDAVPVVSGTDSLRSASEDAAVVQAEALAGPFEEQSLPAEPALMLIASPGSESRIPAGQPRQVKPPTAQRTSSPPPPAPGDGNLGRSPSAPSVGQPPASPPREQAETQIRDEEMARCASESTLTTVSGTPLGPKARVPGPSTGVRWGTGGTGSSRTAGPASERTPKTAGPTSTGSDRGSPIVLKRAPLRDVSGVQRNLGNNVRGTPGSGRVTSPPPASSLPTAAARREKSSEARRGAFAGTAAQRTQSRENTASGPGALPRRRLSPPPGARNAGDSARTSLRGTRTPQGSTPGATIEASAATSDVSSSEMAVPVETVSREEAVEEASDNAKVSLDFSLPLSGSASTVSSDSDLDRLDSVLSPWEAQQQRERQQQVTQGMQRAPGSVAPNGSWLQRPVNVQSSPSATTVPKTMGGTSVASRVQPQQAVGNPSVMMQQMQPSRIVRPPGGMPLIRGSA